MPGEREPAARAIDVLIWLADHTADTWGVREVARAMNTSPSTIYRIFQVFESRDLMTKSDDGRYTPHNPPTPRKSWPPFSTAPCA